MSDLSAQILQYLFDRKGKRIPIHELEIQLGHDIHALRPAIEDLKTEGFITEEEYRLEILAAGCHCAQSRWV